MSFLSLFKREPQTQNGRKQYEHRATFVPAWKRLPDSIRDEYTSGETLLALSLKHRASNAIIRQKLESLGVTIRPKGCHGPNNNHPSKLTKEQITWILDQDSKDVPHAEIARHVNVTRERVRQVCLANGLATRRSRMCKGIAVQEQREARRVEKRKQVEAWSAAWKSGASLEEMSAMTGNAKSGPTCTHGCSRVTYLRSRYPDLFPYRNPRHWAVLKAARKASSVPNANEKQTAPLINPK